VSNDELRTVRDAMRELNRMVDALESGTSEKFVLCQNNRMRAVVISVETFAQTPRRAVHADRAAAGDHRLTTARTTTLTEASKHGSRLLSRLSWVEAMAALATERAIEGTSLRRIACLWAALTAPAAGARPAPYVAASLLRALGSVDRVGLDGVAPDLPAAGGRLVVVEETGRDGGRRTPWSADARPRPARWRSVAVAMRAHPRQMGTSAAPPGAAASASSNSRIRSLQRS